MTSLLIALSTFLADALPPESVVSKAPPPDTSGLGVLVASLAGSAAVVAAATLLVWRRSERGLKNGDGEASAVRDAALGGVSLKLATVWALIAGLFVACVFLLGPDSRGMSLFAFLILLILCPLLGATGAALGGVALALRGPTPRLRRRRALAGLVVNVLPVLFCLYVLVNLYRSNACLVC